MSPSENHLRAALRDGEGDALDPDFVVQRAETYRRARRVRIASMTAAAVTVAVVGVGGGLLLGNGSDRRTTAESGGSAGSGEAGNSVSVGSQYGAANPMPPANKDQAAAAAIRCPSAMADPRSLGRQPSGAQHSLFVAPVASVTLCAYVGSGAQLRAFDSQPSPTITFVDGDAGVVVTSLEQANRNSSALRCGAIRAVRYNAIAVLARYTSGQNAATVVATTGCTSVVSNGQLVRYDWQPPSLLSPYLAVVNAPAAPQTVPGGKVTGTPAPTR